jgi:hypothetical protein
MVASIVQCLHRRLILLLDNHHISSLPYRNCCKCLNQCKKPFNAPFSILDNEMPLRPCGNVSCSLPKVAICTRPHPEKHSIISWWLMLCPPCGPSATTHMNSLLVALNRRQRNCYFVVLTVFCILEMMEILIVINVVCEASKSHKTSYDVIL